MAAFDAWIAEQPDRDLRVPKRCVGSPPKYSE
jgi:hypothetical protein